MKVLSLTQPWASLVALGAKRVETRSWSTDYRGPLAIHASKGFPKECERLCFTEPFYSALGIVYGNYHPRQYLPLGQIIAVCDLADVFKVEFSNLTEPFVKGWLEEHGNNDPSAWRRELAFGDYTPGRYMWLLSNVQALDKPIPARGSLGLWEFEMRDPREGKKDA